MKDDLYRKILTWDKGFKGIFALTIEYHLLDSLRNQEFQSRIDPTSNIDAYFLTILSNIVIPSTPKSSSRFPCGTYWKHSSLYFGYVKIQTMNGITWECSECEAFWFQIFALGSCTHVKYTNKYTYTHTHTLTDIYWFNPYVNPSVKS